MFDPVTVLRRMDGCWVVVVVGAGNKPMEFVCESEDQARAFAHSLSRPDRPRQLPPPSRPPNWFRRFLRSA